SEAAARDPEHRSVGDSTGAQRGQRGAVATDRDDQVAVARLAPFGHPIFRVRDPELDDLDPVLPRPLAEQPQGLIHVTSRVDEETDTPWPPHRRPRGRLLNGCGPVRADQPYCGDVGRTL